MRHKKHNHFTLRASMAAGLLGTLAAFLITKGRKETNQLFNSSEEMNTNLVIGGIAGSLIGITTAMLLAPQSGDDLIEEISHPFDQSPTGHKRHDNSHEKSKQKSSRLAKEAGDDLSHAVNKGKKTAVRAVKEGKAAVKKGTKQAVAAGKSAVKSASNVVEKVTDIASDNPTSSTA